MYGAVWKSCHNLYSIEQVVPNHRPMWLTGGAYAPTCIVPPSPLVMIGPVSDSCHILQVIYPKRQCQHSNDSNSYLQRNCNHLPLESLFSGSTVPSHTKDPSAKIYTHLVNNLSFQKCSIVLKTCPRSSKDENQYLSALTRTVIAAKKTDVVSFFSSKNSSKKTRKSKRSAPSLSSTKRIQRV